MTTATATTTLPSASAEDTPGERPDEHVIVLFGASGDLVARKLLPGFFHLEQAGLLPEDYRIVGTAGTDYVDHDGYRDHVRDALDEFCKNEVTDERLRRSPTRSPTSRSTPAPRR